MFCWQLIKNRLAVKVLLCQRGLLDPTAATCSFYQTETETASHLFFQCRFAWFIWSSCCALWGLSCCFASDAPSFLISWTGLTHGDSYLPWHMLFFVVVWSLWKCRNQITFQNGRWDSDQLLNTIKLRFVSWFKAKWPDVGNSFSDLLRQPNMCSVQRRQAQLPRPVAWSRPPMGFLKFNVDGSALGKPGPAGIGGILRDEEGRTKAIFSKSIGVSESNYTEFLALREAFLIFSTSRWSSSHFLMVESDSLNAVGWLNNLNSVPWSLRNFSNHIELLAKKFRGWRCVHVPREANSVADRLAKGGVARAHELVVVYD